jgi:hypothetical protein
MEIVGRSRTGNILPSRKRRGGVGREEKVGRGWDSKVDVKNTMEKKMKMKMEIR